MVSIIEALSLLLLLLLSFEELLPKQIKVCVCVIGVVVGVCVYRCSIKVKITVAAITAH